MANPVFAFQATVWLWQSEGPGAWHFLTLPPELAADIKEMFSDQSKGFGSLKVQSTIGATTWTTSIFPSNELESYILPLKADVRKKEKISVDDDVDVSLTLLVD
jgi:hypothetical protein